MQGFHIHQTGQKIHDRYYLYTNTAKNGLPCTVIDLFNKEPVAWNISDTQDRYFSIDTIKQLAPKFDLKSSIIHSDQGLHYTNKDYVVFVKPKVVLPHNRLLKLAT